MDKVHSEKPSNPFSLKLQLTELYSNTIIDQFFSVILKSIGGKDFLILVIGESQSGKTIFLSKFIKEIGQNTKPCQLKIKEKEDLASGNNNFPAFLYKTENNQVIILDDAHDLHSQELSIILKNAWDNNKKTTQVILFCEPKIRTTISSLLKKMPKKASVNKLYMPSFDLEQTESYIKHYLEAANFLKKFPFSEKNIKNIYRESKGLPGKINHEAYKILSNKKSLVFDRKKSKSKLNLTLIFLIVTLVFLIIGGFAIFKKTSRGPIVNSNAIQSERPKNTITKKIQPPIDADKIKKTDHTVKINPIVKSEKDKPIVKTKITKPAIIEKNITETDITETKIVEAKIPESETNVSEIAINKTEIPSQKPETQTSQPVTKVTPLQPTLFQEEWILKQEPNKYTIQILAAKEKDAINRFLDLNIHTQNKIAYYKTISNGGVWYKFISGNYQTYEQAKAACAKLSWELKDLGPWPRQFASIHNDINKLINNKTD